MLLGAADLLEAHADGLADLEVAGTGKPRDVTRDEEIPASIDVVRFYAGACRLPEGRSTGEYIEGVTSGIRREPVGVCGQITPWNYVVCGGPDVGSELAAHPDVAMVSVTGSPRTGRAVALAAAKRFARVHLELGGNAPVVICEDADLETTVEQVAFAAFYNAGQDCTAATRVLAVASIFRDAENLRAELAIEREPAL